MALVVASAAFDGLICRFPCCRFWWYHSHSWWLDPRQLVLLHHLLCLHDDNHHLHHRWPHSWMRPSHVRGSWDHRHRYSQNWRIQFWLCSLRTLVDDFWRFLHIWTQATWSMWKWKKEGENPISIRNFHYSCIKESPSICEISISSYIILSDGWMNCLNGLPQIIEHQRRFDESCWVVVFICRLPSPWFIWSAGNVPAILSSEVSSPNNSSQRSHTSIPTDCINVRARIPFRSSSQLQKIVFW